MSGKPEIDIDKLRKSQLMSNEIFKDKSAVSEEIRRKRQKREDAKQAIIRKINEDVTPIRQAPPKNQLEPLPPKPSAPQANVHNDNIKALTNIKVIKSNNAENEQKIKETQERISYTLQMDAISDDQVTAYKRRKARKQSFDINDKFVSLNPKVTYIYIATVAVLFVLVSISLYFLNALNA